MWSKWKSLSLVNKIEIGISFIIRVSLIIAIVREALMQRWMLLFLTSLALFLTFLPSIIRRNYKIVLPIEFEFILTLFVYFSIILGEIKGFYTKFSWWDMLLHGISGIILGFIGFLIVYILYSQNKVEMSPVFIIIFSFCFSVAIGAVWEIFEFSVDSILGMNMQKSGLVDTMWDLIIDSAGAILVSIGGYFYVRGGDSLIFDSLLRKFINKNPHLVEDS